ncbi:MAG: hypothetical protein AVDCRST_MAG59-4949, partial [uncultured Thermomicrobiales bacterium]
VAPLRANPRPGPASLRRSRGTHDQYRPAVQGVRPESV